MELKNRVAFLRNIILENYRGPKVIEKKFTSETFVFTVYEEFYLINFYFLMASD